MKTVRVGVIGVGSLGQHHARIYTGIPEAELVGLYDANFERARDLARKHKTRAFDSMDALAGQIDAASVVVPTDLHREVASRLMERGIHVLVEKPIAATTAEAEAMVALAREKNIVLQVGHVERFNPVLGFLEKSPGAPRFIEAHRLAPFPPPREGLHPRGTEVNVVLDLMIHDIEIILHLVRSEVVDVRAVGVTVLSGSEDIANVRLLFANGCVANITASRISREKLRKIRVFLSDSYVSLDYEKQSGEIYRKVGDRITRDKVPVEKGDPLTNELRAFVQCVRDRDRPLVSGEHAAESLKLAVEITQRMRQGAS